MTQFEGLTPSQVKAIIAELAAIQATLEDIRKVLEKAVL